MAVMQVLFDHVFNCSHVILSEQSESKDLI